MSDINEDDLGPQDLWGPMTDTDWVEFTRAYPHGEVLRKQAIDAAVSPTGALFALVATVGLTLPCVPGDGLFAGSTVSQRLSRVGSYNRNRRQPATSYLCVLGAPSAGKSRAAAFALPRAVPAGGLGVATRPPSGQGVVQEFLHNSEPVKELVADRKRRDKLVGVRLLCPNMLVYWDEATVFDAAVEGKHGGDLVGTLSSAFFGDTSGLSQSAATQEARRIMPHRQGVNVAVVANAQPGTARVLLENDTGLSARFLFAAPSASELSLIHI